MTLEKNTLILNRYRILDILGQGGMGSVYRAVDENLGIQVALKENLFTTDEYARQFRLEAVLLANLRHPNLPRVSDHMVLGDQGQYLVMDFIEGEDLRYWMERLGMLSEDDTVHIGAAICDALAYLHSRKPAILHRDIKPGNVKITLDGHIYLVDFGLAKVYQNASQATITGARAMTPGYSPPEQYGTARTDPRTDIYSLGATLYAAMCGIIPEDGLARALDNAQLTPLRKRNAKVSRRLAAAIEKAMAVDPSDRFQTADDFKKALLGSRSKTQQLPGHYSIAPLPPEAFKHKSTVESEASTVKEITPPRAPKGPVHPVSAIEEDQPFISPLKRQKERERKRRNPLIRFTLIATLVLVLGAALFAPSVGSFELQGMLSYFHPTASATATNTYTPTFTSTSLPASTLTSTFTAVPTATKIPFTATPSFTSTILGGTAGTPSATFTPLAEIPILLGGGTGQIAFASNRTGVPQIYLADLVAREAVQLTNMPNGACQPSWSPDGTRLVFISPCKGMEDVYHNSSLYIINADGTDLTPIHPGAGGDFEPAWSPDGKSIAFASLRTGQMEIFVVNVEDLKRITQVTKGSAKVESRQPAWSPDGSRFVYTVKRLDVYQIWQMDANGENPGQIVRSGLAYNDYLPAWSPDGAMILFNQRCATTFCNPYLMTISADDRTVEQGHKMQISVVTIENPDYSPDGFYLAYEGVEDEGNIDIFSMTVAGGGRERITVDPGADFHPAWRPGVSTP